ncbi:MAG: hypothetical protein OM95_07855 [Bdellovibrio sp. ArHS]|uniref:hypothetical protein n=1 Tax=Bdellovibrio sp. ArHS TaxID=1569284 RepID=UPI00058303D0|nr:hypothetical protein [Bdellovibrio sp. ArHS]KHD88705.1 MAG: hypothetical protein OM95_07855 [Bdellovibrio sp. ArHS]
MKWILFAALLATTTVGVNPALARSASRQPANAEEHRSFEDNIKKIREDDEGIVVLFVKNPGSYYLRRDVENFDGLRKKLDEAFKAKKPVSVTFDAVQLNILEVK